MLKPFRISIWCAVSGILLAACLAAAGGGGDRGFVNPPAPLTMAEQAMGGAEGPFYPSALSTHGGRTLPAAAFTSSQTCGRSGCHPGIVTEWSASAHRFSGLDNPWYRSAYAEMEKDRGKTATRWCAGCHTPGMLASGMADRKVEEIAATPVAMAGVSCTVCHAVSKVKSSLGQADFELDVTGMTVSQNPLVQAWRDLRIRLNPEAHRRAFSRPALTTAEFCSTCHRAHMDQPVNGDRYTSVMDDYGPWQAASTSGQSMTQSIYFPQPRSCVDCHMPQVRSRDAGNHGGMIRSHRFAAANTALPAWRGDGEQLRAVTESLQAHRVGVDIFAMGKGRPLDADPEPSRERVKTLYAPLDRLPATLRRGESTRFDVVVRTRDIGHLFPGGKDVFQDCWLELKGVDDRGRTLFWSGKLDEQGEVDPGAHRFSGLWVDKDGNRVEDYEIWKNRADAYTHPIEPDTGEVVSFRVDVPANAGDALTLTARVRYRKLRPGFTRRAFSRLGLQPPVLPIVTLAESSLTLRLVPPGAPLPDMEHPALKPEVDAERWNDYAFGLANRRDFQLAFRAFDTLLEIRPDYADGWTTLGNLAWAVGDLEQARPLLSKALQLSPGLPRAHYYLGMVEQKQANYDQALQQLHIAVAAYPREALIWQEIGRTHLMKGEYPAAEEAFNRAVAIDPEIPTVHFMLALTERALGKTELSQLHQALHQRLNYDPSYQQFAAIYIRKDPYANAERQPLHEHRSVPLDGLGSGAGDKQKGNSQ